MRITRCPKVYSIEGTMEVTGKQLILTFSQVFWKDTLARMMGWGWKKKWLKWTDVEYNVKQKFVTQLLKMFYRFVLIINNIRVVLNFM